MTGSKTYILIGRFQPYHSGHHYLVQQALLDCNQLIIALGSSNHCPNLFNPWTARQRQAMISACLSSDDLKKISWIFLDDYWYDDQTWTECLIDKLKPIIAYPDVSIIGHDKDQTSYYLHLFPEWRLLTFNNIDQINATDIRTALYQGEIESVETKVPKPILECLNIYLESHEYFDLRLCYQTTITQKRSSLEVSWVIFNQEKVLLRQHENNGSNEHKSLPLIDLNESLTIQGSLALLWKQLFPEPIVIPPIEFSSLYDKPQRVFSKRVLLHANCANIHEPLEHMPTGFDWYDIDSLTPNDCQDDHFFVIRHMHKNLNRTHH